MNFQDVIDFRQARRDLFARKDRALGEGLEKARNLHAQLHKYNLSAMQTQDLTWRLSSVLIGLIVPCQQLYGEGGWYLIQDLAEIWGIDL